jgi:hypothetical protein
MPKLDGAAVLPGGEGSGKETVSPWVNERPVRTGYVANMAIRPLHRRALKAPQKELGAMTGLIVVQEVGARPSGRIQGDPSGFSSAVHLSTLWFDARHLKVCLA